MRTFEMDEGEATRVEVEDRGSPAPWGDLSGATVWLRLRSATQGGGAQIVESGSPNAPDADGVVRGAGAWVPDTTLAGVYFGEIEIVRPGVGWPQVEQFTLRVRSRPAR